MRLRRGITPAISVLILISVAIAVSLIVGVILYTQTRAMGTKGSSMQVTVDAHDVGNGYTVVTVMIKNIGPEDLTLNSINVYAGSRLQACDFGINWGTTIRAGSTASFSTICHTGEGVGAKLSVIVSGKTVTTGTTVKAAATALILP